MGFSIAQQSPDTRVGREAHARHLAAAWQPPSRGPR